MEEDSKLEVTVIVEDGKIEIRTKKYHCLLELEFNEIKGALNIIQLFMDDILPKLMQNGISNKIEDVNLRYDLVLKREDYYEKDKIYTKDEIYTKVGLEDSEDD